MRTEPNESDGEDKTEYSASARLYARARRVLPGGVSRNTVYRAPHPIYAASAAGCRVTDIDGVERIDFSNNVTALIHGHAHPAIVSAVTDQLRIGTAFAQATEAEILHAEQMCARAPGFDKIRFVNSGTEAVMTAVKLARAFTGKPKIAKVEGAYHGAYDFVEISQGPKPENWGDARRPACVAPVKGTPGSTLENVVILPFNNPQIAIELLDEHADEMACVLIDPMPHRMRFIWAQEEFVEAIYEWTRRHDTLLVFDEVITFRTFFRGAQQRYKIQPDLTTMGKMIGGGFPVGAVAGRNEVMSVLDPSQEELPYPHVGTFSANPISMVAGLKAMEMFDEKAVGRLNALGDYARSSITEAIRIAGVDACVTGGGSLLSIHLKPSPPTDYRSSYVTPEERMRQRALLDYLLGHDVLMIDSCSAALSTVMTEAEIDRLAEAVLGGLRKLGSSRASRV